MAYPEPIPIIRGKDAEEFLSRLKNFKLTKEQKKLYKDVIEVYMKIKRNSDKSVFLKISCCSDCPHLNCDDEWASAGRCEAEKFKIIKNIENSPPKWCPLRRK